MNLDKHRQAAENPSSIVLEYEDFKKNHRPPGTDDTTLNRCNANNLTFIPLVSEAHSGAWGNPAKTVINFIAQHTSAIHSESKDAASLMIAERLSSTLHRENARAILKRRQLSVANEPAP